MKWKPALRYKLRQVVVITFSWVLIGVLLELNNAVSYDPATGRQFLHFFFGNNALQHLLITAIGPFAGGLFASFIIFYQREKVKGKTYLLQLLFHSLFYILFVAICILLVGVIGAFSDKSSTPVSEKLYADIFSWRVLRLLLNWYFIVIFTIFLLDVSERYGTRTLKNLLLGKYHKPGKEERIFMFLDLKSSTALAEKIGDERYFRMIRFFYNLASEAIINTHGEIYQYVGDEIVITWPGRQGVENANCLKCFSAINEALAQHANIFQKEYGVVPEFKAAIHCGEVITGEIGINKKDIVYSGDVLNTTARIVALCNHYKKDLIISEAIYQKLKATPGYQFGFLESVVLRGRSTQLGLYSVIQND